MPSINHYTLDDPSSSLSVSSDEHPTENSINSLESPTSQTNSSPAPNNSLRLPSPTTASDAICLDPKFSSSTDSFVQLSPPSSLNSSIQDFLAPASPTATFLERCYQSGIRSTFSPETSTASESENLSFEENTSSIWESSPNRLTPSNYQDTSPSSKQLAHSIPVVTTYADATNLAMRFPELAQEILARPLGCVAFLSPAAAEGVSSDPVDTAKVAAPKPTPRHTADAPNWAFAEPETEKDRIKRKFSSHGNKWNQGKIKEKRYGLKSATDENVVPNDSSVCNWAAKDWNVPTIVVEESYSKFPDQLSDTPSRAQSPEHDYGFPEWDIPASMDSWSISPETLRPSVSYRPGQRSARTYDFAAIEDEWSRPPDAQRQVDDISSRMQGVQVPFSHSRRYTSQPSEPTLNYDRSNNTTMKQNLPSDSWVRRLENEDKLHTPLDFRTARDMPAVQVTNEEGALQDGWGSYDDWSIPYKCSTGGKIESSGHLQVPSTPQPAENVVKGSYAQTIGPSPRRNESKSPKYRLKDLHEWGSRRAPSPKRFFTVTYAEHESTLLYKAAGNIKGQLCTRVGATFRDSPPHFGCPSSVKACSTAAHYNYHEEKSEDASQESDLSATIDSQHAYNDWFPESNRLSRNSNPNSSHTLSDSSIVNDADSSGTTASSYRTAMEAPDFHEALKTEQSFHVVQVPEDWANAPRSLYRSMTVKPKPQFQLAA